MRIERRTEPSEHGGSLDKYFYKLIAETPEEIGIVREMRDLSFLMKRDRATYTLDSELTGKDPENEFTLLLYDTNDHTRAELLAKYIDILKFEGEDVAMKYLESLREDDFVLVHKSSLVAEVLTRHAKKKGEEKDSD